MSVKDGYLPVRPLDRMVTTAMVNRTTMRTEEYHSGVAYAYSPQTSLIHYYDAFSKWRSRLAGGIAASEKALTRIWGSEYSFKLMSRIS